MALVPFLDVGGALRWIREEGVEALLGELTDALADDFTRWGEFELVPRVASHSPVGVIELMPVSDGRHHAFKYVNGHPTNPARGLQTVTAFGVLSDVATGYPQFVAEMTVLTAMRTAATSALAARHLARSDSRVMAMVGAGAQAEFQALAVRAALGINRLQVHDPDAAAVVKFVRHAVDLGFEVETSTEVRSAVQGADVVTTCTADKSRNRVLSADMVAPGTHVNAIGGDCPGKTEVDPALLERSKIFVEHIPQTRVEGEIQQLSPDHPVTELWQVVTGIAPGRRTDDEITLFDSVGFAVEDLTVLRLAQDRTGGTDHVRHLDLVAAPEDPKDLYGLISGPTSSPGDD